MKTNKLSHQETEVIKLVAQNLQDKHIASELGISYGTVRKHRDRIVSKLGLNTRVAITHYAITSGLIKAGKYSSPT